MDRNPLFNAEAWARANNILKEILRGYYSDPPGVSMYTKKLRDDGSGLVKTNKFGMDEIECCRGTNRVEAFHKNLNNTFGSWHVGVGMTEVLLAERRHRHNHNTSERRRAGFPRIGHYDTWLVDSLQSLVRKNHAILLYPNWVNASDYKDTPESFNTVPLHSQELDTAIENKCNTLIRNMQTKIDNDLMREIKKDSTKKYKRRIRAKFKLTSDQKYLCKTMGTKLPLLPFTTAEETKLFTDFASQNKHQDDRWLALEWCNSVDGVNIFPKLPVHIRVYRKKWEKNRRVANCVRSAKAKSIKLRELNEAIQPRSGASEQQVLHPTGFEEPAPQARHNNPTEVVGGTMVSGDTSEEVALPAKKARGRDRPRSDGNKKRRRKCTRCERFGGENTMYACGGMGGAQRCDYYDDEGKRRCYKCFKMRESGKSIHDPYACPSTATTALKDDCPYFELDSAKRIKRK